MFRRFRQRAVEHPGYAVWETDRDFDIDRHAVHIALPGRAGKRELQTLVSRLIATPLDPARPMWQYHLVENYRGGSALIVRIHHSYADGMALVRVMLSMTDAGPDGPPAMPFNPPKRKARADDESALAALISPMSGVMKTAKQVGSLLVERGADLWNDPSKAVALANQGSALTAELAKLATMGEDSRTRFKGAPRAGEARRVGRAVAARRGQGRRPRAGRVGQRRAAVVRRRRDARLPAREGRPDRRRDGARARAGQPAADGEGLQARQPVRARVPRPADRHREPGRAPVRGPRQHGRAQGQLPAGARPRSPRGDGIRSAHPAGGAAHGARAQRHRGDDQRAGPPAAAVHGGRARSTA